MRDVIYIREGMPPHQRLVRATTASEIDRSSGNMIDGKAVFSVSPTDPCFGSGVSKSDDYEVAILALAPVAYYRLNEPSGTVAVDSSGNGYTGTYAASPILGVTGLLHDNIDKAMTGNGTNAGVTLPSLGAMANWTICYWVKRGASTGRMYDRHFSSTGEIIELAVNYLNDKLKFLDAPGAWTETSITLVLDELAFLCWTFDGTNLVLYKDGLAVYSAVHGRDLTAVASAIAYKIGDSEGVNDTLDEFAVFDSALSAATILSLYTIGATGSGAANSTPAVLTKGRMVEIRGIIEHDVKLQSNELPTNAYYPSVPPLFPSINYSQGLLMPRFGYGHLDSVDLLLKKGGSPAGPLSVDIYADDGAGKPGALISSSTAVAAETLTTSEKWYSFVFASPVVLLSNRVYHISMDTFHMITNVDFNLVFWSASGKEYALAGGPCSSFDGGSTWSGYLSAADLKLRMNGAWVEQTDGVLPWIGYIERPQYDLASNTVTVECIDIAGKIAERMSGLVAQRSGCAGLIARDLLYQANARNGFGLRWDIASEVGTPIADIDVSGSSLYDALNKLADESGDEWWIVIVCTSDNLEFYLHWGERRGFDFSQSICLREGYEISDASYVQDTLIEAESVLVMGSGSTSAGNSAVMRVASNPERVAEPGLIVQASSEEYRRSAPTSPVLSPERVAITPRQSDVSVLASIAKNELEAPPDTVETMRLVVNERANWTILDLGIGNIIRVKLGSPWGDIDRRVRIIEMQISQDEILMDVKVLPDA